jgi:hypothetical protein
MHACVCVCVHMHAHVYIRNSYFTVNAGDNFSLYAAVLLLFIYFLFLQAKNATVFHIYWLSD